MRNLYGYIIGGRMLGTNIQLLKIGKKENALNVAKNKGKKSNALGGFCG